MKLYLIIDKHGTGYVTADKQMAEYAKTGVIPRPYHGVNCIANCLRDLLEEQEMGPVEMHIIELPMAQK